MYFRNQNQKTMSVTDSAVFPRMFSLSKPLNKPNAGSLQFKLLTPQGNEHESEKISWWLPL